MNFMLTNLPSFGEVRNAGFGMNLESAPWPFGTYFWSLIAFEQVC